MIKIKILDNIIFLFFLLAFVIAILNPLMGNANFIGIFDLIPNGNLILIIITFIGMIISYFYPYMLKSKSFNKDDFNKNIDYYKDILHEYTPGIISYIDDFKVDIKTLIATLMSLEKKQKIRFKDKIEILNNDLSDLTLHEKYVYKIIEKENFELLDYETLKNEIIKDCDILNLIQPNQKNSIFHSKLFRLAILIEVIGVPLSTFQFFKFENGILKLLI